MFFAALFFKQLECQKDQQHNEEYDVKICNELSNRNRKYKCDTKPLLLLINKSQVQVCGKQIIKFNLCFQFFLSVRKTLPKVMLRLFVATVARQGLAHHLSYE